MIVLPSMLCSAILFLKQHWLHANPSAAYDPIGLQSTLHLKPHLALQKGFRWLGEG